MAKVKEHILSNGEREAYYEFHCPGCGHRHGIPVKGNELYQSVWGFNGNIHRPTFTPSILNRWGKEVDPNWEEPDESYGEGGSWSGRCHIFVTDGKIQFLGDCTHKLAGQTMELPDIV